MSPWGNEKTDRTQNPLHINGPANVEQDHMNKGRIQLYTHVDFFKEAILILLNQMKKVFN